MAKKVEVSPRQLDLVNHQSNTVHGQSPDGRIRVKVRGQNYLVTGTLAQRSMLISASGKKKFSYTQLVSTPGYKPSADSDKKVFAWCTITAKSYRVVGQFKKLTPKPLTRSNAVGQTSTAASVQLAGTELAQRQEVTTKGDNVRPSRSCQVDFERIFAQRAAGLDPDLRMSFIVAFLGESKANLYRKMGKEFPMPIKRGKGSFWPMSKIEAYKAGQNFGVAA